MNVLLRVARDREALRVRGDSSAYFDQLVVLVIENWIPTRYVHSLWHSLV